MFINYHDCIVVQATHLIKLAHFQTIDKADASLRWTAVALAVTAYGSSRHALYFSRLSMSEGRAASYDRVVSHSQVYLILYIIEFQRWPQRGRPTTGSMSPF